ncbi:histidine--tRNA ligase [Mycoplasma mycoides subsp. capri]|uniref:histidine--tRNA ligase n=1 Tax=Mycoplasma mycoides TaxID=2102 RepID=UPI0022406F3B|nr:histidine--tRNA ligase [Mycoplasma mycoides]QVJ96596.1 histidine--tRNA ligase [Mycoplasma mycoides subsp. capri]QVJ97487.1 histidine--tRNA ligase [Mycoplasma mycoides subsp. capri]QVK00479.1 histidine--tRNA ligase [Mycoplasma mycoides subsp. capri]QVK01366.1 histidine--tRNA ligase [Mycoplasma mycoides subsp. capri]
MLQKPRGTQDFFLDEAKLWNKVETKLKEILDQFNYSEIRTPMFESKELFIRSIGSTTDIVSKEMYEFVDKKNRSLVLKPEGTASVVRAVIENKLYAEENLPLKVYYISPMFRYERPQNGRYRQFHQLGIEVFGSDSIQQDYEVLNIATKIINQFKLNKNIKIYTNFLITGKNREDYILELKKYLSDFKLCNDCNTRLEKNPLRVLDCKIDDKQFKNVPSMQDFLTKEQKTRYDQTLELFKKTNISVIHDDKLVRGLDYYTGFIFEIKYLNNNNEQTIIAGGRYNNLVNEIGNINLAACGFGMGLERFINIIKEQNSSLVNQKTNIDLYTICIDDLAIELNQQILDLTRSIGLKADSNYYHLSLKSALKKADKLNPKYVIILGSNEAKTNEFIIKDQINKTQIKTTLTKFIKDIK